MPPDQGEVERLPPQSREAERCVLGSMLRDNGAIGDVLQILRTDNFYLDAHQKLFQAITDLYNEHKPADLVILARVFEVHCLAAGVHRQQRPEATRTPGERDVERGQEDVQVLGVHDEHQEAQHDAEQSGMAQQSAARHRSFLLGRFSQEGGLLARCLGPVRLLRARLHGAHLRHQPLDQ